MAIMDFETRAKAPRANGLRSWTPYRFKADEAVDGSAIVAQLARAVFGVAAAVAGLSLWIVPGSDFSLDLVAMKIAVTAVLWMLAIALWRASQEGGPREIHIDFERQEVRVVALKGASEKLQKVYLFSELGSMEIENQALHLYTEDGERLAVMPLEGQGAQPLSL
ncbi:MAG: hypothetical protein AAGA15_14125 [Pseudomonadota bacterium]